MSDRRCKECGEGLHKLNRDGAHCGACLFRLNLAPVAPSFADATPDIVRACRVGERADVIAAAFQISERQVRRIAARHGVRARNSRDAYGKKMTDGDVIAFRLRLAEGVSIADAAAEFGISHRYGKMIANGEARANV